MGIPARIGLDVQLLLIKVSIQIKVQKATKYKNKYGEYCGRMWTLKSIMCHTCGRSLIV